MKQVDHSIFIHKVPAASVPTASNQQTKAEIDTLDGQKPLTSLPSMGSLENASSVLLSHPALQIHGTQNKHHYPGSTCTANEACFGTWYTGPMLTNTKGQIFIGVSCTLQH
jgi:hypothetical protein